MASTIQQENLMNVVTDEGLQALLPQVEATLKEGKRADLALNLLVRLSNKVTSKELTSSRENLKNIFHLTKICCEAVHYSSETSKKFFSSLHFIFKFFILQGEIEQALKLKEYLGVAAAGDNDAKNITYATYYLLHAEMCKLVRSMHPVVERKKWKMLMNLLQQSLQILMYCGDVHLHLIFNQASACMDIEKTLDGSDLHSFQDDKFEFQMSILKMTDSFLISKEISKYDEVCRSYIYLLTIMLKHCIERENFEQGLDVMKNVNGFKCVDPTYFVCISLYKRVAKVLLDFNTGYCLNKLGKCDSALEYLVKTKGQSDIVHYVCLRLTCLISLLNQYWLKGQFKTWSTDVCLQILHLLLKFSKVASESKECLCIMTPGAKCPLVKNLHSAFDIVIGAMMWLGNLDEKHFQDGSVLEKGIFSIQDRCIELAKMMKYGGCEAWKRSWKVLVIRSHNLACILQGKGYFSLAEKIFYRHCLAFIELEGARGECISVEDILLKDLQCLAVCNKSIKNFKKALMCLAITAVLFPQECKETLKMFTRVKKDALNSEDDQIQPCTLYDMIVQQREKLIELFPAVDLNMMLNVDICQLLVCELESYMAYRGDLQDAIFAVAERLLDVCDQVRPLAQGIEILMLMTWWKSDSELNNKLSNIYNLAVMRLEGAKKHASSTEKMQLCAHLGNIKFYHFLALLKVNWQKQKAEVKSLENLIPTKVEEAVERGELDKEDCNLNPAYINLNIAKETEMLEQLTEVMSDWSLCLENKPSAAADVEDCISNAVNNVETSAYVFTLYGCELYTMKAWLLLYKFGVAFKDRRALLLGLVNLLQYSDASGNSYWKKAEHIAIDLQKNEQLGRNDKELLHIYWLCRSQWCLKNAQYEEGLQLLLKIRRDKDLSTYILEMTFIRAMILLSRYQCVPTVDIPEECNTGALYTVICAFSSIHKLTKKWSSGTPRETFQHNSVIIEVSEWIGELCLRKKMPREVRSYLKMELVHAQMLMLATRSAQFLSKLAQIDAFCFEVQNCKVKAMGISTILQTSDMSLVKKRENGNECPKEEVKHIFDNLTLDDETRTLVTRDVFHPSPQASPVLKGEYFSLPYIADHRKGCKCFPCNSITVHTVMLEVTMIEAQIYSLERKYKYAMSFFNGGVRFAHMQQNSQKNLLDELSAEFSADGSSICFAPLQNGFLFSISKLLHQYAEFLALSEKFEESQKLLAGSSFILNGILEVNDDIATDLFEYKCSLAFRELLGKHSGQVEKETESAVYGENVPIVNVVTPQGKPLNAVESLSHKHQLKEKMELTENMDSPPRGIRSSLAVNLFADNSTTEKRKPNKFFKTPRVRTTPRSALSALPVKKLQLSVRKISNRNKSSTPPDIVIKSPNILTKISRSKVNTKKCRDVCSQGGDSSVSSLGSDGIEQPSSNAKSLTVKEGCETDKANGGPQDEDSEQNTNMFAFEPHELDTPGCYPPKVVSKRRNPSNMKPKVKDDQISSSSPLQVIASSFEPVTDVSDTGKNGVIQEIDSDSPLFSTPSTQFHEPVDMYFTARTAVRTYERKKCQSKIVGKSVPFLINEDSEEDVVCLTTDEKGVSESVPVGQSKKKANNKTATGKASVQRKTNHTGCSKSKKSVDSKERTSVSSDDLISLADLKKPVSTTKRSVKQFKTRKLPSSSSSSHADVKAVNDGEDDDSLASAKSSRSVVPDCIMESSGNVESEAAKSTKKKIASSSKGMQDKGGRVLRNRKVMV